MSFVLRRPRPRPNHPAALDVADRLSELESVPQTRLQSEGDAQCRVSRDAVEGMPGSVRGRRELRSAAPVAELAGQC